MGFCLTLLTIAAVCVVAIVVANWDKKAAYRLLEASQHFFEPDDAPSSSGARLSGVKVHERRVTPLMKKKIGEQYDWRCACGCGEKLSFDYHVDHIVPLWQGGTNRESNLQPLNPRCHAFKTSLENAIL